MTVEGIEFVSGISIVDPSSRLAKFLAEEYEWYDAFIDNTPENIMPFDILAAVGVNAFIGGASVTRLRAVHAGLSSICDAVLPTFSTEAELRTLLDLSSLVDFLLAATYVRGALSAVVTKVLHRKRRELIPILDSVMVAEYCSEREARVLADSYANERLVRAALTSVLGAIQNDLGEAHSRLLSLSVETKESGTPVGPLRIHDILVWTEKEQRGYYR